MAFELVSPFKPTGDQPRAIERLVKNLKTGMEHQVLLGVTGSGKTFTMANVIQKIQKPVLVISPNKTLAAQLYQEFKEFFPNSGVHYFVSYYDYYQPEAYIPQSDTYIEKDAKINDVLDRLRHEAVQDVLSRKDVIVVASVSCIYSIGSPEEYQKVAMEIRPGHRITRRDFFSHLTQLQYQRNDIEWKPGMFRARGDVVEIHLVTGKEFVRVEFAGNEIETISVSEASASPSYTPHADPYMLYPAKFWVAEENKLKIAVSNIRLEAEVRVKELRDQGKLLEAQRLEQRTNYDMEMIEESGYCHGIENYSRHLEFRKQGDPPFTLIDYFGKDFLVFVDESHLTLPQIKAMSTQDRIRKESLVNFGFRLPSAIDNRPLTIDEFFQRAPQITYVSATPGSGEKARSGDIVEQIIRPTGLLEPAVEIRPSANQIKDIIKEIRTLKEKGQRALVITVTKRLAEDIADYLAQQGISVQWLHSEVKTLARPSILEDLRRGKYDVLVGINLLREGLDLPEVSLVAILDADKEGFLRNETTLIQTMGRAARHVDGKVIMYADHTSLSMASALEEIRRRRDVQEQYNKEHHITPQPILKEIKPWEFAVKEKTLSTELDLLEDKELLEKEMQEAASSLDFERAAHIRDLIKKLKPATTKAYANHKISKKGSPSEHFAQSKKHQSDRNPEKAR
ncbi:MAG: excinuclease ABC subunit UvrB [bacterium]|nr:excinuclease ABC subunit UvrB [bacterium]